MLYWNLISWLGDQQRQNRADLEAEDRVVVGLCVGRPATI